MQALECVMSDLDAVKELLPDNDYLKLCDGLKRARDECKPVYECLVVRLEQRTEFDSAGAMVCRVVAQDRRLWLHLPNVDDVRRSIETRACFHLQGHSDVDMGCENCAGGYVMSESMLIIKVL